VSQFSAGGGEVRLVYCLSIDLIGSTIPGLRMTQGELDRFNRALVAQIEPHLEALAFDDLLVKFTGDGWLLMSPELRDAERLCALATIMRANFTADMQARTRMPESRIPALRMAICAGRDIRVQLWHGSSDWVGDSARRANRSAGFCFPNEVLVDGAVHSLVMRDFVTSRVDPGVRPVTLQPKRFEEEIPLWSLEDLRIEAVEDWDAAAAYVYALGQVGRTAEATEASLRAASRLGPEEPADLPSPAGGSAALTRWNRLLANAPTHQAVTELWTRLVESGTRPNVDTLNVLIDRAPTFGEALGWLGELQRWGVRPDAVSFNTLIRRAPDHDTALGMLDQMAAAGVAPTTATLHVLVVGAPSFRAAIGLLPQLAQRGVTPDLAVFGRLVARAPDYDRAVGVLDTLRRWGLTPDTEICNRLIAKAPSYEEAAAWLDTMRDDGVAPDVTTFNTLIARSARYGAAAGWIDEMGRQGVEPDVTTFNTLMSRAPDDGVAAGLLGLMDARGVIPNSETFKALITRAPDYATATGWLERMGARGLRPNNEVFKALIGQSPDYATAAEWLARMRELGVAPNTETFRTLMSRAPDFATARRLLDEMTEGGVRPTGETFKTLASLAPDHATAIDLLRLMPAAGVRPEADTFLPLVASAPDFAGARTWLTRMGEWGVAPTGEVLAAVLRRAPDHDIAAALLEETAGRVEPNESAYRVLVEMAPDFPTGRAWIERMRSEGMRPGVGVLSALLAKDPGGLTGDDLLAWYLALDHHPSAPMQAGIETFLKRGRVEDAVRLALDYPHLEAARTVFRLHAAEALDYLGRVLAAAPGHANGHYAMGLALLEQGRHDEAVAHLEMARELARPGPRVTALEEILRVARAGVRP
jgi:tetratricopeptide (TPR) repeat protein